MPDEELQSSNDLQAALETVRRDVMVEIANGFERVSSLSPGTPGRTYSRMSTPTQLLRDFPRTASRPTLEAISSVPNRLPSASTEFGYLTDVRVPGIGRILEPGAFGGALFQLEGSGLPNNSPDIGDRKPDGLPAEDLGLPGSKERNDPLPEAWEFKEGADFPHKPRPAPESGDRRNLGCGSQLLVTATFEVNREVLLAEKTHKVGEVFIGVDVAAALNEGFRWTVTDLKNQSNWLNRVRAEMCKWGKERWAEQFTKPVDSPSIPAVASESNQTDGRSEEEQQAEGSGPIYPPKWIQEEVVCEPRCVPHWYYLGCNTLNVKELARYYRVSGLTVSLLSYVTATLRFTWRVVCEELAETPEGKSLLEGGAISNSGTSIGHYRRKQWDGPVPEPSKPPEGCCCVIESIELVNVQSFNGPLTQLGGSTRPDRWGHKCGIKIKYWYKSATEELDCNLIWLEWTNKAPAWTGLDNQNPRWRDISKLYPDSPVFDAWKTRPVTLCYSEKPDKLTEVILPLELTVAWEDKLGKQARNLRDLWLYIKATGCENSAASICIQQHLEAGDGNIREGWIGEVSCTEEEDPTSEKPVDAVDYTG